MSEEGQLSPGSASAISTIASSSSSLSMSASSPHPPRCGHSQESLIQLVQLGILHFLEGDQCCRMKLRDHSTGIFTCGALFSEHSRWDYPTPEIQPASSIIHPSIHLSGPRSVAGSSVPSSLLKNLNPPSIHGSGPLIPRELIEQANRPMDEVVEDDQSIQDALGGLGPNSSAALDPVANEEEEEDPIDESYSIAPERVVLPNSPSPRTTRDLSPPPMSEVGGTILDEMVHDLVQEVPVHGEYQFLFHVDTQDDKHLAIMDFFRLECQGQSVDTDWIRSDDMMSRGIHLWQELPFKIKVVGEKQITLSITHIGDKGECKSAPLQLEIKEVLERLILALNSEPSGPKRSNMCFIREGMTHQIPIDKKPIGALVRLRFEIDEVWIRAHNL